MYVCCVCVICRRMMYLQNPHNLWIVWISWWIFRPKLKYSPLLEWKPLGNCVVKAFLVTIGSMILVTVIKKELLSRRNSHSGWCFKASETCLSNWIFSSSLKWGLKPRYHCWELDAQISKKRLLQVAKKITRNYGIQCVHWIHVGSTVSCMLDLIRFPWVPWSKHISLDVSSARPELQISLSIFFGEFYKKKTDMHNHHAPFFFAHLVWALAI